MAKHGAVLSSVWGSRKLSGCGPLVKLVFVYLLTSPLRNAAMLFHQPLRYIATDLEMKIGDPDAPSKTHLWGIMKTLHDKELIYFDPEKEIVFVHQSYEKNHVKGPKSVGGVLNMLCKFEAGEARSYALLELRKQAGATVDQTQLIETMLKEYAPSMPLTRARARVEPRTLKSNSSTQLDTAREDQELNGSKLVGEVVKRFGQQRIDFSDPDNRNAFANQQVAKALTWEVVMAARDPNHPDYTQSREACLTYARSARITWDAKQQRR